MNPEKANEALHRAVEKDPQGVAKLHRRVVDNIPSVFLEFCRAVHKRIEELKSNK